MWRPGEHHERLGRHRRRRRSPGRSTARAAPAPRRAARRARSRPAVSSANTNACWRTRRHSDCTNAPDAPGGAEVLAPVLVAPQLEPVDDERGSGRAAAPAPRPAARSTGTSTCGRRRRSGRGAAGATARPRRTRAAAGSGAARAAVERQPRPGGDDAHARHLAALAARPLAQRQVGHVMPVGREPLREVAVPALGAADRVREQAVVDDADPHAGASATSSTLVASRRSPGTRVERAD